MGYALLIGVAIAIIGLALLTVQLSQGKNPLFDLTAATEPLSASVSVVIPAYNEALNVRECLLSVLNSTTLTYPQLEVWLVDDQSTDHTLAIAQTLQRELNDPRLQVLAGADRPVGETWVGKNWACARAAEKANGEFLLFLDADTRLLPGAIEASVQRAIAENSGLLSCGPALICGCLAEWLVQPLMISIIQVGFDFAQVNDPQSPVAFAAGPFMLFRRTAYDQIGGHRAVADQVVEDVELSRRIKQNGLTLKFLSGAQFVTVRMYQTARALWEGWTKNLYLGSQRSLRGTLGLAVIMLWFCTLPWIALILSLISLVLNGSTGLNWSLLVLSAVAIAEQFNLRRVQVQRSQIPMNYWWLTGLGGLTIAAIAVASIIKTETGWGWTWRGRALKLPTA